MSIDAVRLRRHRRLSELSTALLLLGLACGADDDSAEERGASEPSTEAAPQAGSEVSDEGLESVAGCESGFTDLNVIDSAVSPARCEAGSPEPQPLAERQSLTFGTATTAFEQYSVMAVALAHGEFERENLDIQVRVAPSADLLSLMASGDLDARLTTLDAGQLSAITQGIDIRWGLGGVRASEDAKVGYWMRAGLSPCELKGKTLGTRGSLGTASDVHLHEILEDCGLSLSDLRAEDIPLDQVLVSLENGGIDIGGLTDPYWTFAEQNPDLEFLASTRGDGWPTTGIFFGPEMVNERRDVAAAFARAYVRTISTYFVDDYKSDPEFVAELSRLLELPVDSIEQVPSLDFDYEMRFGVPEIVQETIMDGQPDVLKSVVPEGDVYDFGFLEEAIGHKYAD